MNINIPDSIYSLHLQHVTFLLWHQN